MPLPNDLSFLLAKINAIPPASLEKRLPAYAKNIQIGPHMKASVLSILGGADITPFAFPSVTQLTIVDRLPFLTVLPLAIKVELAAPEEAKLGLFHEDIVPHLSKHGATPFATMETFHVDYNSPYEFLNPLFYQFGKEFFIKHDRPGLLNYLATSTDEERSIGDIGISSMLLYRLRICLNATIVNIIEIIQDKVFEIRLIKDTGQPATLFYCCCTLGAETNMDEKHFQWLLENMHAIDSIYLRGLPQKELNQATVINTDEAIEKDLMELYKKSGRYLNTLILTNTMPYRENFPTFIKPISSLKINDCGKFTAYLGSII